MLQMISHWYILKQPINSEHRKNLTNRDTPNYQKFARCRRRRSKETMNTITKGKYLLTEGEAALE